MMSNNLSSQASLDLQETGRARCCGSRKLAEMGSPGTPPTSTRNESPSARRLRQVETHGYNGLALLTTYDGWRYFEPSDIDGFIAYELHRGTAVACGDPVCAEADVPELMS